MNHITNDRGDVVLAIGSPGSIARLRVQYPKLRERINVLWMGKASAETAREECTGKGTFDSGYRLTHDEAFRFVLDCYYGDGGVREAVFRQAPVSQGTQPSDFPLFSGLEAEAMSEVQTMDLEASKG